MTEKPLLPATIAAQAGGAHDPATGGVVPGIHPATTFLRDADYAPLRPDNIYARDHSDNLRQAETVLARLEQAEAALLFPSGMAAIAAVFRTLPPGCHVIVQSGIYWGTTAWVRDHCTRQGITLHSVDTADSAALAAACTAHRPALVHVETPSNPWLKITDIAATARAVQGVGGRLLVDSTAATPVLSQPLALGADIVMHSATKAINGHSDVLAGVLATNDPEGETWQAIARDRHDAGAVLGPFEAWLLLRGMRTLPLRVERMSATAQTLAAALLAHPGVADVFYPGLPHHPGHALAAAQMKGGFGGLMSVLVKGDRAQALRVAGRLRLFLRATSLGGVESLVEHRATLEPASGIPDNLLRVSVGIEDAGDLLADWMRALG